MKQRVGVERKAVAGQGWNKGGRREGKNNASVALRSKAWMLKHSERIPGVESS